MGRYNYLTINIHEHTIVITMQSTIIQIGNSKGVRLTKEVLILSGIKKDIEIKVKKGEIKIIPKINTKNINEFAVASEASFAQDWLRPEEEEVWKIYQLDK
jgi:antitoxin component of MazEF toxin-antitoxin module